MINIQTIHDNKCFKWCLVRHLHNVDHHSVRIKKVDKYFATELAFKDIEFLVKVRDNHNVEKKNYTSISVFG